MRGWQNMIDITKKVIYRAHCHCKLNQIGAAPCTGFTDLQVSSKLSRGTAP